MVQLGAGGEEAGLTEEGKNIAYEGLTCNPRQCEIEELYALRLKRVIHIASFFETCKMLY